MTFTKRLHPGIIAGEITQTLRIWKSLRAKVGGRYPFLAGGEIEVTRIREVELTDITPEMARRQGFAGLVDLLKVAKHGSGQRVFLIDFEYHAAA
ncbi:MAG TPA: ASCH domain-containing protein [Caulobacteraceae bacterium]